MAEEEKNREKQNLSGEKNEKKSNWVLIFKKKKKELKQGSKTKK